jgi:cell wall-associated NlpC family hydrolase
VAQASKFLEIAQAEVGTAEGPKENETKYGKFTKHNFQPWCGSFVMWCAKQVEIKIPNCVYTPAGKAGFMGLGTWFNAATEKPQTGDIVFFDFPGGDKVDHVGIILKDNGDGTVTTIEGNTSPEKKPTGSQANGGEVAIRIRAYKAKNKRKLGVYIVGFGRPKWK